MSGRRPAPALDALVVGSGLAGLTAALDLAARGAAVTVVTKTALGEGSTAWAQGGIAAVVPGSDDAVDLHVADTLAAGAGLSRADVVRAVCGGGAAAVAALAARGVAFDVTGHEDGPPSGARSDALPGAWARGLEAAHSRPRVLHAGGDVTGARITAALVAAVRAVADPGGGAGRVRLVEHAALVDLVVDAGRVTGADVLVGGERVRLLASAVVLATGGAGQLYAHTTNPDVATADGVAAAWRAGALVADPEMVQFHPTAARIGGRTAFLVSEAVRGEGAVLRDERGRRFLADGPLADPRAELAPRDVVARAIAAVMAGQDGHPALLDATGVAAGRGGRLDGRFPGIDALCRAAGVDWTREPVPVTPAAHYWMGGVAADDRGRTSLPGLWAVGEVACTGLHGANRLASNSLLEAAVVAARAADDTATGGGGALVPDGDVVTLGGSASVLPREELQALVWEHAGVLRDEGGLRVAAKALTAPEPPGPGGAPGPTSVRQAEDAALATAARLVVAGALARTESRGAHHRTDHPLPGPVARRTLLRRSA